MHMLLEGMDLIFYMSYAVQKTSYHSLVTFEIIKYSGCESAILPSDITQLKEALLSDNLVVDCSNANLKYFGIPLSIYNFLFSNIFLLIIILNAYKKKI